MSKFVTDITASGGVNPDDILYVLTADHGMTATPELQDWAFEPQELPVVGKSKFKERFLEFYTQNEDGPNLPNAYKLMNSALRMEVNRSLNEYLQTTSKNYLQNYSEQLWVWPPTIFLDIEKIAKNTTPPQTITPNTPGKYARIENWFKPILNNVVEDLDKWKHNFGDGSVPAIKKAYHLYQLTAPGFYESDPVSQTLFRKPRFQKFLNHYANPDDRNYPDRSGQILIVPDKRWYFFQSDGDAAMHGLNEWQDHQ